MVLCRDPARSAPTTTRYAKQALRVLAGRYRTFTSEIRKFDSEIRHLCARATASDNPRTDGHGSVLRCCVRCETCLGVLGRPPPLDMGMFSQVTGQSAK